MSEKESKKIPKRIFIIPYRNRGPQLSFFCKWMNDFVLKGQDDYEIYFSHQYDKRTFNRGAIKNIGFIIAKKLYPNDYKNITFIFNDIDCLPYRDGLFAYDTNIGTVSHYYGLEDSLGGIIVIKGIDFEQTNGYNNLYSWGQEDTCLQKRCQQNNLIIDRTNFYEIGSKFILQLFDGVNRIINNKELNRGLYDDGTDGIRTITNLIYTVDKISKNKNDNNFLIKNKKVFFINVYNFLTKYQYEESNFTTYDLRKPEKEIFRTNNKNNNPFISSHLNDDWTNIPLLQNNNHKSYQLKQPSNSKQPIKPRATTSIKVGMGGIIY